MTQNPGRRNLSYAEALKAASEAAQAPLPPDGNGTVEGWHERDRLLRSAAPEIARAIHVLGVLLAFPDKTLIPWTEWSDARYALKALDAKVKP